MFEIEDLFDLTLEGAFANKEEFLLFAKDATNEELFSLITPGAFENSDELSSFLVKKKDEPDMESVSEDGLLEQQEVVEEKPLPFTPIASKLQPVAETTEVVAEAEKPLEGKTFQDFELATIEPLPVEEIEANVLTELQINPSDYNAWKEENTRPESKSYRFLKEILLPREGVEFERQETVNKRINSYLASQLNKDLETLSAVEDPQLKATLDQEYRIKRQKLLQLLPTYEKETVLDERKDREQLLNRSKSIDPRMRLSSNLWEAIKSGANAAVKYSTKTAAAIPQFLDTSLASAGADKKGVLAGMTEALLDAGQAWDLDLGETKRPMIIEGKKVIHNGEEYLVDEDGTIYDYNTNIRVDDILPKEDTQSILEKSDRVKVTEKEFNTAAGLAGITGQVVNLYGLIRSGRAFQKILGVGPKLGMGLASYTSTIAGEIADVRDDLINQGLSEEEATLKALAFGNVYASLDGIFSAAAGGNEKVIGDLSGIKQILINYAKENGKNFTEQQLKTKLLELAKENAKELFIEEIPVLITEKATNNLLNYATNLDVRAGVESLSQKDFLETAILTVGSTTALGSKGLLSNNQRKNAVRMIAQNVYDIEKQTNALVKEGLLSQQEANNVIKEVRDFQLAENKTAGAIKMTDNMLDAAAIIEEKDKLIQKRENMDPALRGPIDALIKDLDRQLVEIQQKDAADVDAELGKTITQEVTEQEVRDALKAEGVDNPTMEQMVQKSEELMAPKKVEQQKLVSREEALQSLKEENEARLRTGLPVIRESEENIKKQQEKLQEDAIQEQEARDIPDAQRAEGVQEMEAEVREPVVEEEVQESVEYTLPEKNPLSDFEIINNRGGRAGLEIDNEGNGRYYVRNKVTDRIVAVKNKAEAEDSLRNLDWDYGEGDLVPFEPEQVPVKKEKPVVERKPIAQSQIIPSPKTGKPSKSQINIAEDGTLVSVTNIDTGKDVSLKTQQKAEQSFLTTGIDVNKETRIDENPDITPEQYVDEVIQNGNNIKEIVEAINIAEQQAEVETVEDPMLSELEGRKFTPDSWTRMTGLPPKEMKRGFSRTWISKDGESIEDLENMEEVIEFIKTYPTASDLNELKAGDMDAKNQVTRLKEKFEALTGVKPTAANLKVVQNIDPLRPPLEAIAPQIEAEQEMVAEDERLRREQEAADAEAAAKAAAEAMMSKEAKQLKAEMEGKEEFPSIKEVVDRSYELGVSNIDTNRLLKDLGYSDQDIRDYRIKEEQIYVPIKTKLGKVIPKVDNLLNDLNKIQKSLRSARKFLPKSGFYAKESMDAMIQTEIQVAERLARKFNKLMQGQPESVYDEVNNFMNGKKFNLPIDIAKAALEMRLHVDTLSKLLVESGAVKSEGNQETIMNNLGAYLNRSYKLFDDPNYAENIPNQLINEAREYLKKSYYSSETKMAEAQEAAKEKGLPVDEWIDKMVDLEIQDIINKNEANAYVSSATTGSKNLKSLKQRKPIPAEIRALMGEYNDPAYNYVMSVAKIKAMIENQKFLEKMLDIGKGVFLFDKTDIDRLGKKDYVKIAAEGNESLSPLDGYYAPKELVEQLKEKGPVDVNALGKYIAPIYKGWLTLVGRVKQAKTIYSVGTHAKNVLGNAYFMAQNGYFNPKDYKNAYSLLKNDFKNLPNEELSKKLDEYKRLGIVNQSIGLNEIREMLGEDSFDVAIEKRLLNKTDNRLKNAKDKVIKGGKKFDKFLQDLYQAEDDLFKIVAFENEKKDYAKIMYDGKEYDKLDADQKQKVDQYVSDNIVKNILPNYSRLGGLAKGLRAVPIAGTFISFQLEAWRTAYNTMKLGIDEVSSDNPKMRTKGAKRLASVMAFQGLKTFLYSMLGQSLLGGEEEEEEKIVDIMDIRGYLPSYRKNSDLRIFDVGDGKFSYIDLSSSDPYGGLTSVLNAYKRGDTFEQGLADAAKEFGGDILGADILASTVNNLIQGKDKYGKDLYKPGATDTEKLESALNLIYETFEPGTITSARKIKKALEDKGMEGALTETLGQFTGFKPYTVDVEKVMSFKLKDVKDEIDGIKKQGYSADYEFIRTRDTDKLIEAWKKVDQKLKPVFKEANRDVEGAMKLGVPMYKIDNLLASKKFNNTDAQMIFFYNYLKDFF